MRKRLLSLLCVLALMAGLFVLPAAAEDVALDAQGWLEAICAEISGVTKSQITTVSWTGPTPGSMASSQSADEQEHGAFSFKYLVRDMDGGVRIDIPGLKPGTYSLTVTAAGQSRTVSDIQVSAYDRSGFAHWVYDANGTGSRYTEGVGAYNDNGTLKDNAYVVYVTNDNKNTITIPNPRGGSVKGIGYILNAKAAGNNQILKGYSTSGTGKRPLAFRFVGTVSTPDPESLSKPDYYRDSNNEWDGGNGYMASLVNGANLTLEGIGADATIDGWGFDYGVGNGDTEFGCGKNLETRNLSFRNVPEDCMAMGGNNDNDPVSHVWIHNCSFYVPTIPYVDVDKGEEVPTDGSFYTLVKDKTEGDGATDNKLSRYTTVSYNYYHHYHKTGLMGGGDTQKQYHITWHHNFFDGCDQRVPLIRQADLHYYNNLVKDQKTSGISLRANCYVFAEYNSFESCKSPIENKNTGGVCKSYENVFTDTKGISPTSAAVMVTNKSQTVESANPYANFDTNPESYVAQGDYLLDADVNAAKALINAYAGAMKAMTGIDQPDVHHHQWGAWEETVPATCTTAGSRYRLCPVPGCPLGGREEQTTQPQGHKLKDGKCTACGVIDISQSYTLDLANIGAVANLSTAIEKGIFTVMPGGKIEASNKSFEDGTKGTYSTNPGGTGSKTNNSIKIDAPAAGTLTVWWRCGSGSTASSLKLMNASGTTVGTSSESGKNDVTFVSALSLPAAGTYYVGGKDAKANIYRIALSSEKPKVIADKTLGDDDELTWSCTGDGTLNVEGCLPESDVVLAALWKGTRFLGVRLIDARHMGAETGEDWDSIRLFWLDGQKAPQCGKKEESRPQGR